MTKKLMIDPPSGWKYGFPKPLPEEFFTLGSDFNLEKWLVDEGYPECEVDLALKCSRYWEANVDVNKGV